MGRNQLHTLNKHNIGIRMDIQVSNLYAIQHVYFPCLTRISHQAHFSPTAVGEMRVKGKPVPQIQAHHAALVIAI
jgi:hypothetical protein